MDLYLFQLINKFILKWLCLDALAVFFAEYFEYVLLCLLLLFLAVRFKKRWKIVFQALLSAILARFVIVDFIRWAWQRPRPFLQDNVKWLLTHDAASFPSGHAAFYFAISTVIYIYNKKIGVLFFVSSFLICFARVFAGIHWPSDILAGAVIGIFSGWLVYVIFKRFKIV